MNCRTTWLALASLLLSVGLRPAAGDEPRELTTFYFGNSFTGNTMPELHPLLGASAGKSWKVDALISPGVPIWVHMKNQMDQRRSRELFRSKGPEVDAIVMLLFGGEGLSQTVTEKWQGKVKFDRPSAPSVTRPRWNAFGPPPA